MNVGRAFSQLKSLKPERKKKLSSAYLFHKNELEQSDARSDSRLASQRISQVLDKIIWWAALSLIPLVAIPHGGEKIWWQAAFECGVLGIAALWIVNGFFKGSWPLKGGTIFLPLLILAGYIFLQTLPLINQTAGAVSQGHVRQPISLDIAGTYHFLAELLVLIILGKLLLDYTDKRRRLAWIVYVVIGVGVASAAFGLVRFILERMSPDLMFFGQGRGMGFGQFTNRNYFALMLEMALGLGLGLILGDGVKRQHRLFHLGLVMLLATTIVFTTSRGGVLSMVGQLLFLALWFTVQRIWRKSREDENYGHGWLFIGKSALTIVLVGGLVTVIVIGIANLGGEELAQRMDKVSTEWGRQEDVIHGQRGDIWRATLRLVRANPVTGVGFGAYQIAIPKYHEASGSEVPSSSLNSYLDLAASGGLIGVALAVWFVIILLLKIRERLNSRDRFRRAASLGALAGLFGVAAHSLVDSGLQVLINAVIFFVLIVIGTSKRAVDDNRITNLRQSHESPA